MNYETVDADVFGKSLRGVGLNLLVRDVKSLAGFLCDVFGMQSHQVTGDFAIMTYGDDVFQLHSDGTYHSHPLPSLLPENGRGAVGSRYGYTKPTRMRQLERRRRIHMRLRCLKRQQTSPTACANVSSCVRMVMLGCQVAGCNFSPVAV